MDREEPCGRRGAPFSRDLAQEEERRDGGRRMDEDVGEVETERVAAEQLRIDEVQDHLDGAVIVRGQVALERPHRPGQKLREVPGVPEPRVGEDLAAVVVDEIERQRRREDRSCGQPQDRDRQPGIKLKFPSYSEP